MKKYECPLCKKLISAPNFKRHFKYCKDGKKPTFIIPDDWITDNNKFKCKLCGKIFSRMGMISHYYRVHTAEGREFVQRQKPWKNAYKNNPHSWNAGKTKNNNESLKKLSNSLKKHYETCNGTFYGKKHTEESRKKLRQSTINYISSYCKNKDIPICPRIGKNENDFFDCIQKHIVYVIRRNQLLDTYFPDGYIKELFLIIEFNEPFHETSSYHIQHDIEKINNFKKLGIFTINVKESDWLSNRQQVLENVIFIINCREVDIKRK